MKVKRDVPQEIEVCDLCGEMAKTMIWTMYQTVAKWERQTGVRVQLPDVVLQSSNIPKESWITFWGYDKEWELPGG